MLFFGIKPISKDEYIPNCEEYIVQIENNLGISIPRSEKTVGVLCNYYKTRYNENITKEDIYEIGIQIDEENIPYDLYNNENWITTDCKDLMPIVPFRLETLKDKDYNKYDIIDVLIYNKTLNKYNMIPSEKGTYEYIALLQCYDEVRIFNYRINIGG